MKRYARSIEGLLEDTGFRRQFLGLENNECGEKILQDHVQSAKDFADGPGKRVQETLLSRDAEWAKLDEFPYFFFEKEWDDMYLELRCTNPVNVNPGYIINPIPGSQARRAACMVYGATHWLLRARNGQLREERLPQCVSQVSTLYGTTRIPRKGRDILVPMGNEVPKHIVIQRGGRFFKVDVLDADGSVLCVSSIEARVRSIVETVTEDFEDADGFVGPPQNVGLLTGLNRDEWAELRTELEADPTNRETLTAIDSALLIVALDLPRTSSDDVCDMAVSSQNVLHGLAHSRADRWWDKTQLIVEAEGQTGFQFEHSHSDGAAWNFWLEDVVRAAESAFKVADASVSPIATPSSMPTTSELRFVLSDNVARGIQRADAHMEALANNVETTVVQISNIGRARLKSLKVSPDAMAQLAYLTAHRQIHGWLPPTYEACSTRQFFHGRTETIRSATPEAELASRLLMSDGCGNGAELADSIREMATGHSGVARAAAAGEGIDRHLMCLNLLSSEILEEGGPDAAIARRFFDSPIFSASKHFALSTSNVSAPFLRLFTFGPVVPNGYGIGYQVLDDSIPINITAWNDDQETSSAELGSRIQENLNRIVGALEDSE